jgi:radical SAM protein with 4Fe4S-binding SPASM domain
MQTKSQDFFCQRIRGANAYIYDAHIELTYRCNLNCIHCYCQDLTKAKELTASGFKSILDQLCAAGCLRIVFSGGEPFIHADFLDIYDHAKKKGFIVTIFTNGVLLDPAIIRHLVKSPPASIEITLPAISPDTYDRVTRTKKNLDKVIFNIQELARNKLPVIVKTTLLKENCHELGAIKKWVDVVLGKTKRGYHFKYDAEVYPRLNQDRRPLKSRIPIQKLISVLSQDKDIWEQFQQELAKDFPPQKSRADSLYHCDCWMEQAVITPDARLKLCLLLDKNSIDLKETPLIQAFSILRGRMQAARFKTVSSCRKCRMRPICGWCPAKAYLFTGSLEKPVRQYCDRTKELVRQTMLCRRQKAQYADR